jgi:hypothetical protein
VPASLLAVGHDVLLRRVVHVYLPLHHVAIQVP